MDHEELVRISEGIQRSAQKYNVPIAVFTFRTGSFRVTPTTSDKYRNIMLTRPHSLVGVYTFSAPMELILDDIKFTVKGE